ncbi:DUF4349 domain-containing protein [Dyadobacter sp. Leaf189]|uniref:DUF4349 domain-containing protein n=1 Tax=Dyadobacter sp. Leaf189 TaxID=1736295 RepID=UPI0006F5EA8E|nr:DUF4349 domain-containing protein [Dyadobacter sp. Leaf189]KQS30760.1 hypothetical protein ASG33_10270 [Dyadobacter sp. Leaf189]
MKNLILFFVLLLAGCSQQNENAQDIAFQVEMPASPPKVPSENGVKPASANDAAIPRKLIREGELAFETTNPENTRKQITTAAAANEAYIATDQQTKSYDRINYVMLVRIPAARFDSFINAATKGISHFDKKEIRVRDVTAEYIDSEARLKTKKDIENRYKQLLAKASSVADILAIEKELGAIRTEIEATEGQLKLLKDQVQYATLQIEFYTVSGGSSSFMQELGISFSEGWDNLRAFSLTMISIWPFLLIVPFLWFIFSRVRNRKVKQRSPEEV